MSSAPPTRIRIGIDTGGTFTDFILLDHTGIRVHKLRSTPHNPAEAILAGLIHLTRTPPQNCHPEQSEGPASPPDPPTHFPLTPPQNCHPERSEGPAFPPDPPTTLDLTHGSTVATNALLERKGARTALLTTAGFEDVLLIARQTRRELYNFQVTAPRPLIPPGLTFGIHERLAHDGTVLTPLDPATIPALIAALEAAGAESVAICLLHSYANPAHEQALAQALTAAGFPVSASHAILPEYREFERFSTTAVNAYVTPLMSTYLTNLEQGLSSTDNRELTTDNSHLRIMQSNGGSISATQAKQAAVQTILSGPAGGVVGAQALAAASGFPRIITFDMGGTSTDVALVDGAIGTTNESIVGDFPVRLPVLDIHTVGAGGGSIAFIDSGGSLRVGPRSAGANPGPACYGTASELTVTDANLLLGRLDPTFFLGGRMALDLPRTRALARTLGKQLGLSEAALAEGILRIANSNMERAIRIVSVARGHDPRDFALLAFGGAGGLHACALASALDIATVLIPRHSGVLSALGMLLADVTRDYSAPILRPTAALTEADLLAALAPLLAAARATLLAEGFAPADILLTATLDMRYRGQSYEIAVPFAPEYPSLADSEAAFHRTHARLYGYSNPARPTEVVQLRLKATGRTDKPQLTDGRPTSDSGEPVPESGWPILSGSIGKGGVPSSPSPSPVPHSSQPHPDEWVHPAPSTIRPVLFNRRPHPTPIFHRDSLSPGHSGPGPALILTGESTNLVAPNFTWRIDPVGTLILHSTHTAYPSKSPQTTPESPQATPLKS